MRLFALVLGASVLGLMSGHAGAQYYSDRPANGPQRDDQPPYQDQRQQTFGPPERGAPLEARPGGPAPRPWPTVRESRGRGAEPPCNRAHSADAAYRRAGTAMPDAYRRFWDDRDDRRARTVDRPLPPPPRYRPMEPRRHYSEPRRADEQPPRQLSDRHPPEMRGPPGRGMVTISAAEYRALQDQAHELQRLLAVVRDAHERRDFREPRDIRERSDFRDVGPGPGARPSVIYR